jgi:Uma2 family endonuclease
MSQRVADIRMTADQYEELGRAGVFDRDKRLELLEGEIHEMAPIGSRHITMVNRLAKFLIRSVGESVIVNIQNPVRLSDLSEPVPDLSVVKFREDEYLDSMATASDVLLLIEVADSSLYTDRRIKLPLYAIAGIPEAWIVNLRDQKIEVFTKPVNGTYSSAEAFARGAVIHPTATDGVAIKVDDVFDRF